MAEQLKEDFLLKKKLKTAPCQQTCPASVDVPRYIRYIRMGKFREAYGVIRESIPFPAVCGYACFHPCEAHCARRQYDEALSIRMLKRAAVEFGGKESQNFLPAATSTRHRVAVVGSGPSGLTAAYYLAGKGHRVTVFEKRAQPGGLMRYGIPEYRLPNEVVEQEIAVMKERGVEIKTNSPVFSPAGLLADGFAAVCVATGAWESMKIHLQAADAAAAAVDHDPTADGMNNTAAGVNSIVQVTDGLAFLEAAFTGELRSVSGRMVVVGGGNTAIDTARTAIRLGAKDVTIVYRRTRSEMPASPEEVVDARQEGVKFQFLAAPVKVGTGELICVQMALGETDASGRPQPQPVANSEFGIPCDQVILAVGQAAAAGSVGLPADSNGTAQVVADSLAVDTAGVYAAGDVVKGPSSIIEAIAQGRMVAAEIDKLLGGDGTISEQWVTAEGEDSSYQGEAGPKGNDLDFAPPEQIRSHSVHIPLSERVSTFRLAECGYERETAQAEAVRCLGCDIHAYEVEVTSAFCKECGYCREVCEQGVYEQSTVINGQGYRPMVAAATDKCVGCLKCLMICPDFAISVGRTQ